jgi:peptidylamidoglycolate lyase
MQRRTFLHAASAFAGFSILSSRADEKNAVLGQGDFKYRVVPNWGVLGAETPVSNCHGMVQAADGRIFLFTDNVKNNVLVYDKSGKLLNKWGTIFPGAHGMNLVREGAREVLYLTDLKLHKVFKTTLDGEVLNEWGWPKDSGKYAKEDDYKPSWTIHFPSGEFYVLDGYGKDFILHYSAEGKLLRVVGGAEGGIVHWGPHGGMADLRDAANPKLLIAMSDQQSLWWLDANGQKLSEIKYPGSNPRMIRPHKDHYFIPHLGDDWPANRSCRGYVSVLNADFKVVSNIGGTAPEYDAAGTLAKMKENSGVFIHPHDVLVDTEGSVYVAQFASKNTYPIKLERI